MSVGIIVSKRINVNKSVKFNREQLKRAGVGIHDTVIVVMLPDEKANVEAV